MRLPKEYRFAPGVEEVKVRERGGKLILEPVVAEVWPEDFWSAFGRLPGDFERPAAVPSARDEVDI